jgi:hypothetical protein
VKKLHFRIFAFFISKPLPWLPVIVVSRSHDDLSSLGDFFKPVRETLIPISVTTAQITCDAEKFPKLHFASFSQQTTALGNCKTFCEIL